MSIFNIIGMIPKGGKYAKSVVNFVRKAPENWPKFKEAIKQIDDLLKQGKLKLDGKQKTIFESNKNILKNHEKVTKKVELPPSVKKEYPPFNTSKEDFTKGWKPTVYERQNLRNIYKELDPPASKYTKEMEAIDEELNELMLYGNSKYAHLSAGEKAALHEKLQAEMQKLIKVAMKEDLSTLSLSQLNKKSHNLQKRIREIADDPNIKGTVTEGPKRDMIKALYDSENVALTKARNVITKRNSELKYGKKYPVLDPENDAFVVLGLDERGNPIKISRFTGKFSATKDKTGELTSSEGTSFYDKWNAETNQMRKEGEEVFHETLNREGKVIMSNPEYKLPKTQRLDIQTEFYTDLSTNELSKKGFKLKQIDMIKKGRKVREYLNKTKSKDTSISMHEQTSSNEIGAVLEDLYHRGDDVYKMSIEEWVNKIPEYFAGGGRVAYGEGSKEKGIMSFFTDFLKDLGWGDTGEAFRRQKEKFKARNLTEGDEHLRYFKAMGLPHRAKHELSTDLLKDMAESWAIANTTKGDQWKKYKRWLEMENYEKANLPEGFATGGVSNLFRERQGYRSGEAVIKLAKGARWVIRMLKELSDDMILSREQFAKMAESIKTKLYIETQAAIKHLEAGGEIPKNLIQSLRQDARFKDLRVSKGGDKDFVEIQEVVLGKTSDRFKNLKEAVSERTGKVYDVKTDTYVTPGTGEKILEGKVVDETVDLMAFKKTLPKDLLDKVNQIPVENQENLLKVMKQAFDAAKKGNIKSGVDVLQKDLLERFIPKGKGNAEGGRIGFNSGGNGGTHPLMPELEALTWKSLRQQLSPKEVKRMDYLIDATGSLDEYKAEGGRAGYDLGGPIFDPSGQEDLKAEFERDYGIYKSGGGKSNKKNYFRMWSRGNLASGGRIGYATGGVSNLFRSR